MKKLLLQLDTDIFPSVFDSVVAYDGGADHLLSYGAVTPEQLAPLIEGAIFTRAPKDKKNTAIFVGGSDLQAGQHLLAAIKRQFFADFRVSVMLDSNGCNTTAAAGVSKLANSGGIAGKKAVVLAGTGPVGQRAAVMLAKEGAAEVIVSSRSLARSESVCENMKQCFNVNLTPNEAVNCTERADLIADASIVFATGAAGIQLLEAKHWESLNQLEMMADANATPPLGIGGTDMMDRGTIRSGKIIWGAIGFGTLKLALHRACIRQLFEANNLVMDAEEIYALARSMDLRVS